MPAQALGPLPARDSAEPEQAEPGQIVAGRYRLEAVLGRGGMADVYRATDQVLERAVAVKVLRGSADRGSDLARFTAEARTLAQLSHSGLVMVLDAGITAEQPYLVMELIDGPTLAQVLEAGPMDARRVGSLGVQLADALAYAHQRGVVHRDVKPGNVLLGHDGRVKLADFGIARLLGDTVHHTRTGQTIGTAAYLAPEQVTGREVGRAADVYALGLVLLEALTGVRAYPGPPTEAAIARLTRPPDIPRHLRPDLQQLLAQMVALDPGDRPEAAAVAARLRDQPTGPIPAATVRDIAAAPARPATPLRTGATKAYTEVATADVPPPVSSPATSRPAPQGAHLPDRAGDVLARSAREAAERALRAVRGMPHHVAVVAAAIATIIVLIVVVAIAGNNDGGRSRDLPSQTPPNLRQPLSRLHDAVEGGQ